MKLALISPRHKQGLTTVSIMLANALANTTNLSIVLTQVGEDQGMLEYLGINDLEEDKTRTTTQMIKLIESNDLSSEDMRDYMIKINNRLRYLNTQSARGNFEETEQIVRHLLDSTSHGEIQVYDINRELYDPITQDIIKEADIVFIVAEQTRLSADMVKRMRESEYFPDPDKVCYIFNLFDPRVMSSRETAKMFGIRHRRTVTLSYNAYIKKYCNLKKLDALMLPIKDNDERVLHLNKDVLSMAKLVATHIGFRAEWR